MRSMHHGSGCEATSLLQPRDRQAKNSRRESEGTCVLIESV